MIRLVILLLLTANMLQAQQKDEIRKSIYFEGGRYYIDQYQAKELSRWIDSIPNLLEKFQIQLISHTDPVGGREYNEWLSKKRSEAVFNLLVGKDIPDKIIHVKDWGLNNPVYSNDSDEGRRMNRRVDVILHPIVF